MNIRSLHTVLERRRFIEEKTGVALPNVGTYSLDERRASTHNCENMIGVAQVPIGVAGPLSVVAQRNGGRYAYESFVPLATTEGALVASINRGCKAIGESGGALVDSVRVGVSRGPVFSVRDAHHALDVEAYIRAHADEIAEVAQKTSGHIRFMSADTRRVGTYVFVRFVYDTQDAMGLNMVTIATDAVTQHIEHETGAACLSLSGNVCVDKKPSWQNVLAGRGFSVHASVSIPAIVLEQILKVNAQQLHETWLAKCMVGSAASGSMGYNAQYANVVAALYIATGQDPAHVVEGSVGITTLSRDANNGIQASVFLPSVLVGTVGGGTALATQKEALEIMGVFGGNNGKNSHVLSEIVGAAALAGELSLLSGLAQGTIAATHERLGRGKTI